jgi:hypothetical protein
MIQKSLKKFSTNTYFWFLLIEMTFNLLEIIEN